MENHIDEFSSLLDNLQLIGLYKGVNGETEEDENDSVEKDFLTYQYCLGEKYQPGDEDNIFNNGIPSNIVKVRVLIYHKQSEKVLNETNKIIEDSIPNVHFFFKYD